MLHVFRRKSVKVSLIVALAGVLITCGIFVYYGFHLGIKPCKGLPSDAANCGDADFGGVIFILAGVPIALLGTLSLVIALLMSHFKPHFDEGRFLRVVCLALAALIAGFLLAVLG